MKLTQKLENKKLTIAIDGRLDTLTAPDLEEALTPALAGIETLVVDLSDLMYISSAGLRVLVGASQVMDAQNGKMAIVNASPNVREVFEITGLTDVLGVAE